MGAGDQQRMVAGFAFPTSLGSRVFAAHEPIRASLGERFATELFARFRTFQGYCRR